MSTMPLVRQGLARRRAVLAALAVACALLLNAAVSSSAHAAIISIPNPCGYDAITKLDNYGRVVAKGGVVNCALSSKIQVSVCLQRLVGGVWSNARCAYDSTSGKRSLIVATEPQASCTPGRSYRAKFSAVVQGCVAVIGCPGTPAVAAYTSPQRVHC